MSPQHRKKSDAAENKAKLGKLTGRNINVSALSYTIRRFLTACFSWSKSAQTRYTAFTPLNSILSYLSRHL